MTQTTQWTEASLAEALRDGTEPIYTFGAPGDRDHVAVWKHTSSSWTLSYLSQGGSTGRHLRSRLKAARYALALAAVPHDERLTLDLEARA